MYSIKKWAKKPRKTDTRILAQFYFADEDLIRITRELDSFDGQTDTERCSQLIAELRFTQEKVIGLIEEIKNIVAPGSDSISRDFRVKFPDEILQDNLAGHLWFGAECLCAGSTIVDRETESIELRPLARQVIRSLGKLRGVLREQALRNIKVYPSTVKEAIANFDQLFAEFEYEYVSILSRVRSVCDHEQLLDVSVLFCETTRRAVSKGLLTQDLLDDFDAGLMITIPRLAVICGLLVYQDGPLDLNGGPDFLPKMFRPYYQVLCNIKELLVTLSVGELTILEKSLCSEESFDEVVSTVPLLSTPILKKRHRKSTKSLKPLFCAFSETQLISNETGTDLRAMQDIIRQMTDRITGKANSEGQALASTSRSASHLSGVSAPVAAKDGEEGLANVEVHSPSEESTVFTGLVLPRVEIEDIDESTQRETSTLSSSEHSRSDSLQESSILPTPGPSKLAISPATALESVPDSEPDSEPTSPINTKLQVRETFACPRDLIHSLFVCISRVADQLQSDSANDLRQTLKSVFVTLTTNEERSSQDVYQDITKGWLTAKHQFKLKEHEEPPPWTDDSECRVCNRCHTEFSLIKRRHHCRLCGGIYCHSCASSFVPLPRYGLIAPVRVCRFCVETA